MVSERYFFDKGVITIRYSNGTSKTIDGKGVITILDKDGNIIKQLQDDRFSYRNEEMISICDGMIIDLYGAKFKLIKVEEEK
jgi:hypothetical protein